MNSVIIAAAKITLDVMEGKNLDKSFEKYFKENSVFIDDNKIRQIKSICYDSLRHFKTLDFFLQIEQRLHYLINFAQGRTEQLHYLTH